jgi:hypothetical protein
MTECLRVLAPPGLSQSVARLEHERDGRQHRGRRPRAVRDRPDRQTVPEDEIQEAQALSNLTVNLAELVGPALATALVLGAATGAGFAMFGRWASSPPAPRPRPRALIPCSSSAGS